jgi:hypothetical protein
LKRNVIHNEAASATVLDLTPKIAYLAIPTHVPGCPFSSEAMVLKPSIEALFNELSNI